MWSVRTAAGLPPARSRQAVLSRAPPPLSPKTTRLDKDEDGGGARAGGRRVLVRGRSRVVLE